MVASPALNESYADIVEELIIAKGCNGEFIHA